MACSDLLRFWRKRSSVGNAAILHPAQGPGETARGSAGRVGPLSLAPSLRTCNVRSGERATLAAAFPRPRPAGTIVRTLYRLLTLGPRTDLLPGPPAETTPSPREGPRPMRRAPLALAPLVLAVRGRDAVLRAACGGGARAADHCSCRAADQLPRRRPSPRLPPARPLAPPQPRVPRPVPAPAAEPSCQARRFPRCLHRRQSLRRAPHRSSCCSQLERHDQDRLEPAAHRQQQGPDRHDRQLLSRWRCRRLAQTPGQRCKVGGATISLLRTWTTPPPPRAPGTPPRKPRTPTRRSTIQTSWSTSARSTRARPRSRSRSCARPTWA